MIAVAGPMANFILAIAIYAFMSMAFGEWLTSPQIGRVVPGTAAEAAGFKVGDRVLSIDGREVREFGDIMQAVSLSGERALAFRIARGGKELTIVVTPRQTDRKDPLGNPIREPTVGIGQVVPQEIGDIIPNSPAAIAGIKPGDFLYKVNDKPVESFGDVASALQAGAGSPISLLVVREGAKAPVAATLTPQVVPDAASSDAMVTTALGLVPKNPGSPKAETFVRFGPVEAVVRAVKRVWFLVAKTLDVLGHLLTGTGDVRQLSGPIGIAQVSGQIIDQMGPAALIGLLAVLSVSIGLLNLFPIPMLDGGHLLYYGIEAVRGRPLGEKAQELGFQIGLALVVGLVLIATWNDIKFRLF